MKKLSRLTALVVGVAVLALVAVAGASAAGNPHATYTCVKIKKNGESEVRVNVPEPSVAGHENAGFTCALNEGNEGEDPGNGDEDPAGGDDTESEDTGEAPAPSSVVVDVPQESRTLYCSTHAVERANGDGIGVALNLPEGQGKLMVEMGLATAAIFYDGIGASCDVLPGFKYSGKWVDNVGAEVSGVAVYPLYVAA
jgi:hypothetical protein